MLGLLLRAALGISLLLTLLLGSIQPSPARTAPLNIADGCAAPCFLGIRPGSTTLDEALQILNTHPWVAAVQLVEYRPDVRPWYGSGTLNWQWSAAAPEDIDRQISGQLIFVQRQDITLVDSLRFHTHWPTPLVEAALGQPRGGSITRESDFTLRYRALFSAAPNRQVVGVMTQMACPANLLSYWYSSAELVLTAWVDMYGDAYRSPTEAARLC